MIHVLLCRETERDIPVFFRRVFCHEMCCTLTPGNNASGVFPLAFHSDAGEEILTRFHLGQPLLTDGGLHPVCNAGNRIGDIERGINFTGGNHTVAFDQSGIAVDSGGADNSAILANAQSGRIFFFKSAADHQFFLFKRTEGFEILPGNGKCEESKQHSGH